MDELTEKHFQAWLSRHVQESEWESTKAMILAAIENDATVLDRLSYWQMFDRGLVLYQEQNAQERQTILAKETNK